MPLHDWSRVHPSLFHSFHLSWIVSIDRALNAGILPSDHYALIEAHPPAPQPEVQSFRDDSEAEQAGHRADPPDSSKLHDSPPMIPIAAEADLRAYYRRDFVGVRRAQGHDLIGVVEVVLPGHKKCPRARRRLVERIGDFLENQIHVLLVDVHPANPEAIHGAVWDDMTSEPYTAPSNRPLTLASYGVADRLRAYVEHLSVGEIVADMPLFLGPGAHVVIPLEATYQTAFASMPRHIRATLEATSQ